MSRALPNLADTRPGCVERTSPRCLAELKEAGVPIIPQDTNAEYEVKSILGGSLAGWTFIRHWYYWGARGPKVPLEKAKELWKEWGEEIRWGGDCVCREPKEDGYPDTDGVHIDTQEGLNKFAEFLRSLT